MKTQVILLILAFLLFMGMNAATLINAAEEIGGPTACDFLIGKWDLTWKDKDGTQMIGKSKVKRILNDRVIKEECKIKLGPTKDYKFIGHSVYLADSKTWKLNWMDSDGSFWEFNGAFSADKRSFQREFQDKTGKKILQRVSYSNISPEEITCDWDTSEDSGKTWKSSWHILYQKSTDQEKDTEKE